jgi:hypothetical protein
MDARSEEHPSRDATSVHDANTNTVPLINTRTDDARIQPVLAAEDAQPKSNNAVHDGGTASRAKSPYGRPVGKVPPTEHHPLPRRRTPVPGARRGPNERLADY